MFHWNSKCNKINMKRELQRFDEKILFVFSLCYFFVFIVFDDRNSANRRSCIVIEEKLLFLKKEESFSPTSWVRVEMWFCLKVRKKQSLTGEVLVVCRSEIYNLSCRIWALSRRCASISWIIGEENFSPCLLFIKEWRMIRWTRLRFAVENVFFVLWKDWNRTRWTSVCWNKWIVPDNVVTRSTDDISSCVVDTVLFKRSICVNEQMINIDLSIFLCLSEYEK